MSLKKCKLLSAAQQASWRKGWFPKFASLIWKDFKLLWLKRFYSDLFVIISVQFFCIRFGTTRVVCAAHLRLLFAAAKTLSQITAWFDVKAKLYLAFSLPN